MRLSFALTLFFACLVAIVALKVLTAPPEGDATPLPDFVVDGIHCHMPSEAEQNELAYQDAIKHLMPNR